MKFVLYIVLFFTQSCTWFESDYDKLMNPIKKIKLSEKLAGKANPVFDGVVEPNFPDEKENDKTLEGVDSNQDGVRDDIEIWINRTAEDEYVRWAMKDYYRKSLISFKSVYENQSEKIIHQSMSIASDSAHCYSWMQIPFSTEFTKNTKLDSKFMPSSRMLDLFPNNVIREKAFSKWNIYQIKGALGGDENYCSKSKVGIRFKYLFEKLQEHRKW